MTKARDGGGAGGNPHGLEPPPTDLLDRPLDYILADHFRQRHLCSELRSIADKRAATRAEAEALASYLTADLPRHHQDEDLDVYPALLRRTQQGDDIDDVLQRLALDHDVTERQAEEIVKALAAAPSTDPVPIDDRTSALMHDFAAAEQRHLAIENGIILVIARKRLKPADLQAISDTMKARRGLVT